MILIWIGREYLFSDNPMNHLPVITWSCYITIHWPTQNLRPHPPRKSWISMDKLDGFFEWFVPHSRKKRPLIHADISTWTVCRPWKEIAVVLPQDQSLSTGAAWCCSFTYEYPTIIQLCSVNQLLYRFFFVLEIHYPTMSSNDHPTSKPSCFISDVFLCFLISSGLFCWFVPLKKCGSHNQQVTCTPPPANRGQEPGEESFSQSAAFHPRQRDHRSRTGVVPNSDRSWELQMSFCCGVETWKWLIMTHTHIYIYT